MTIRWITLITAAILMAALSACGGTEDIAPFPDEGSTSDGLTDISNPNPADDPDTTNDPADTAEGDTGDQPYEPGVGEGPEEDDPEPEDPGDTTPPDDPDPLDPEPEDPGGDTTPPDNVPELRSCEDYEWVMDSKGQSFACNYGDGAVDICTFVVGEQDGVCGVQCSPAFCEAVDMLSPLDDGGFEFTASDGRGPYPCTPVR